MTVPEHSEDLRDDLGIVGSTIAGGKYQIVKAIGFGSMGTVYEAIHADLRRTVAIKVLHPSIVRRATASARFKREAHTAARLTHRNTVQVLDFGSDGPIHYIVMEYVQERTSTTCSCVMRPSTSPG